MLQAIQSALPVLLAAAVFAALGLWCFFSSQRALERSPKQLDWIRRHDQGGYPFPRDAFPAVRADWLGVFGVAVFALVIGIAKAVIESRYTSASWLGGLFSSFTLLSLAIDTAGAICLYFLLQRLFGSTLISACCTVLWAASPVGVHTAGALLAAALLLLVLYLSAEQSARLFPAELLYWLACLLLSAALARAPALLPVVLLFIGLHLFKLVSLLRHDAISINRLVLLELLALLVWAVLVLAFAAMHFVIVFGFNGSTLSKLLGRYGPLGLLLRLLRHGLQVAFKPFGVSRVLLPAIDAPLLGLGCFGALSGLLLWTRRQDARAKLLLPILGMLVLVWLLADVSVMSVGLALTTGLLFHNFLRDRVRLPVILVTVLGVVCELAILFLAFRLPLADFLLWRMI